ncbi:vesicle transport v-snare protein vti1 [Collybia nuda]|uniref:Vesicle transport v-snare protein vti1 n=1 Tax=Collybia nuda TaxID=64659 RepID=A0A9P5YIY1_9AGAR|nr:vesicle transport v-snare protein vti1 [Collybia nuda]
MDNTPTALFTSHELDLTQLLQGVHQTLDAVQDQEAEARKKALRRVEVELDGADDVISQLELEIQGIPRSMVASHSTRLTRAKAELARAKKRAREVHTAGARRELVGAGVTRGQNAFSSDDPYTSEDTRTRLLTGTAILEDGSRRLTDTQRIALEAEDVGAGILRSLRGQREVIEGARGELQNADINIDRASGTIKKMIHQMYKQRFILSAIGVFLVLLVITILYFKMVR